MLPTLFHVQGLARVDLHLCFSVGLGRVQPAVTGEHVLLPVDWNHELNAVQEPAGPHAFIGVANQQAIYLQYN